MTPSDKQTKKHESLSTRTEQIDAVRVNDLSGQINFVCHYEERSTFNVKKEEERLKDFLFCQSTPNKIPMKLSHFFV